MPRSGTSWNVSDRSGASTGLQTIPSGHSSGCAALRPTLKLGTRRRFTRASYCSRPRGRPIRAVPKIASNLCSYVQIDSQRRIGNLKDAKRKPKKITFFGLFGQGNLGNECTLQAILYELRQRLADAEVNCICTNPEVTSATHNIAAISMRDNIPVNWGLRHNNNPLAKLLRNVFVGYQPRMNTRG